MVRIGIKMKKAMFYGEKEMKILKGIIILEQVIRWI